MKYKINIFKTKQQKFFNLFKRKQQNIIDFENYINKILIIDFENYKNNKLFNIDFENNENNRNENNIKPFILYCGDNFDICYFNSGEDFNINEITKLLLEDKKLQFKEIKSETYKFIKLYHDAILCVKNTPDFIFREGLFSGKDFLYNGEKNIIEFTNEDNCNMNNIKIKYGDVMNKKNLLKYLENDFHKLSLV
jgi:hypothetical protein